LRCRDGSEVDFGQVAWNTGGDVLFLRARSGAMMADFPKIRCAAKRYAKVGA